MWIVILHMTQIFPNYCCLKVGFFAKFQLIFVVRCQIKNFRHLYWNNFFQEVSQIIWFKTQFRTDFESMIEEYLLEFQDYYYWMTAFKIKLWITLFSTSRLRISDTPKQKNQTQTKSPKCAQSEEITFTFLDPSSVSFQIFECAYERKRKCMLKPVWFVNSTWLNKNMIIKE